MNVRSLARRTPALRKIAKLWQIAMVAGRPQPLELRPLVDLKPAEDGGGVWQALSNDPQFQLSAGGSMPLGISVFRGRVQSLQAIVRPRLYFDLGQGYSEAHSLSLACGDGGVIEQTIFVPLLCQAIRFGPADTPGLLRVDPPELTPLGVLATLKYHLRLRARQRIGPIKQRCSPWLRRWVPWLARCLAERLRADDYAQFLQALEPPLPTILDAVQAHQQRMVRRPRFSIVMPTYDTPIRFLDRAIESVRAQTWSDWELCIADDLSPNPAVRRRLREWAAREPRIRLVECASNGGISAASNQALALATGEYVAYLDHDDELSPLALYHLAVACQQDPPPDLIYSDEDKITPEGTRFDPHFKPDWNPDLLYSQNYIAHLAAYRREQVVALGGLRSSCDGSQDHDLALRVTAASDASRIVHVPAVLYHWRAIPGSTALATGEKSYPHQAGARALQDRFAQVPGVRVEPGAFTCSHRVRYPLPAPVPRVSVIIPTRDGGAHLRACVESLLARSTYPELELLLVDNGSRDAATLDYLAELARRPRIQVLPYDHPFNFSAINNFAARQATGQVLVLLNDDTEILTPDWLEEMVSLAVQQDVGAVGAKLRYPDGAIQHAGVVLGLGGIAGHVHLNESGDSFGYMGRLMVRRTVSAVTAACLAVERRKYLEVGGLDEVDLTVAFNDVDFCLRLRERGWRNVWTPFAELIHHESKSRGQDLAPEKRARFEREVACMSTRWARELARDPHYSPHFSRQRPEGMGFAEQAQPLRPWLTDGLNSLPTP